MPEIVHSQPISLATSKLRSQLVLAHVAVYWRERALMKVGLKTSVVKSSDHSKGDDAQKSN